MADHALSPSSSTGEVTQSTLSEVDISSMDEPIMKKPKLDSTSGPSTSKRSRLEERLNSILCCTVCLDAPTVAMYQCLNGHLMCAGCHAHLIADSRLRDETATCPNCRCDIKDNTCVRNRAVEKALSELPTDCIYCTAKFARNQVDHHQENLCHKRTSGCRYQRIGCTWTGPYHDLHCHEQDCLHPQKTGSDILDMVTALDGKKYGELNLYRQIFDLLSFPKIAQSDPQLRLWRTDDFCTKVFYESSSFSAFGCHWAIRASMNGENKDPTQVSERSISYQLILKSDTSAPLDVHYLVLKGPNSNYKIKPIIYRHEFKQDSKHAPSQNLGVEDGIEVNKILSQRTINLRIFMFQVVKSN